MTIRERIITAGPMNRLVGLVTEVGNPDTSSHPTVVFLTAGLLHKPGPFRMHTTLSRRLAAKGYRCCRFDQSGRGDSDPPESRGDEVALAREDVRGIMQKVDPSGKTSFILCGLCSGADDILLGFADDPKVVGAVLFDGICHPTPRFYFDRYVRRAISISRWTRLFTRVARRFTTGHNLPLAPSEDIYSRDFPPKAEVERNIAAFLNRGAPLLFVFSGGVTEYLTYGTQLTDAYKIHDPHSLLRVVYLPQADHTYSMISAREEMFDVVERWITETRFTADDLSSETHR